MTRLVLFTDLDGTLLDHDRYDYVAAIPALERLAALRIPVVLASSKTAAEMRPLHAGLGLAPTPFIVENGAGIVRDAGSAATDADWRAIRAALAGLDAPFRGFGDMDPTEIAACTGLSVEAAERARMRQFSEPGLWRGDAAGQRAFVARLAEHGITARHGGRFLTLSFGRTKADAMAEIAAELGAAVTVALGDAPNDAEMLAAADRAVIVRNDHAPPMPDLPGQRVQRTDLPGPEGWNAAVLSLLTEFGLQAGGA